LFHDARRIIPPARVMDAVARREQHSATLFVFILPYLEEGNGANLWDMQKSYYNQTAQAREITVAAYFCPSRRAPPTMSIQGDSLDPQAAPSQNVRGSLGDYAGVCGDFGGIIFPSDSLRPCCAGFEGTLGQPNASNGVIVSADGPHARGAKEIRNSLTFTHVRDGLSKTLMIGEKHVNDQGLGHRYLNGVDYGDGSIYNGDHNSFYAAAGPGYGLAAGSNVATNVLTFGSMHPEAVLFAFADGSVTSLTTGISDTVLGLLSVRNDGQPIPDGAF
jgi:hypothetical protein